MSDIFDDGVDDFLEDWIPSPTDGELEGILGEVEETPEVPEIVEAQEIVETHKVPEIVETHKVPEAQEIPATS